MGGDMLIPKVDAAWFIEILLMTVSWVILARLSELKKDKPGRIILEFIIMCLAFAAGNYISRALAFKPQFFHLIWLVMHGAVSMAYMAFRSSYRDKTRFVLWCSQFAAILSISAIAGQCSFLTGRYIASGAPEGIARCIIYLLMLFSAMYLRKFNFDDFADVPGSGLSLIIAIDVGLIILYIVENIFFGVSYQLVITLLTVYLTMFAIMLVAINAIYSLCAERESVVGLQAERQRLLSEREMTHMTEATLEDLRCIRHDLKNQYAYMQILLEAERYEDLKNYFSQVSESLPSQLNFIECGNHAMNNILKMGLSKMKSDRIKIEHHLVVPPVLPFSDDDMCAIIINLMDNAAEECWRLLDSGRKDVDVRLEIYPHRSYLYIMCSNTTDRAELSRLKTGIRTTKKDTQLHGYGTKIITKLAEKHNGAAEFSLQGDRFVAKVMLDMTIEEATDED